MQSVETHPSALSNLETEGWYKCVSGIMTVKFLPLVPLVWCDKCDDNFAEYLVQFFGESSEMDCYFSGCQDCKDEVILARTMSIITMSIN